MKKNNEYLTVYEMSRKMNVTAPTVYNWIKEGLISEKRPYGRKFKVVISTDAMDEFIKKSNVEAEVAMNND